MEYGVLNAIVDLKIMQSLTKEFWVKDYGKMNFAQYWGYDIQGCIYQTVVFEVIKKQLPFFIAGASKEPITDIEVIEFYQSDLDDVRSIIDSNMGRILKVKSGEVEPDRCGQCDYCRHTKVLTAPVHFSELTERV